MIVTCIGTVKSIVAVEIAAHALCLGAVGSTSADDEVTAHFSPHAAGKSFMLVTVFGPSRPAPRG